MVYKYHHSIEKDVDTEYETSYTYFIVEHDTTMRETPMTRQSATTYRSLLSLGSSPATSQDWRVEWNTFIPRRGVY